jgi:glycosyltransferase involved in cell wall biosynthesis
VKVLIISPHAPYDNVPHAGGKIHNYYIKQLALVSEVKLITFANRYEKENIALGRYDIDYDVDYYISYHNRNAPMKILYKLARLIYPLRMFKGICGFSALYFSYSVIKRIKKLKRNKYIPGVIVLDWTLSLLLIKKIKFIYPTIRTVCLEYDVSFQGFYRSFKIYQFSIKKIIAFIQYLRLKRTEVKSLKIVDAVQVLDEKDKKILVDEKIDPEKIIKIYPYFDIYTHIKRENLNNNIIFWGAMDRRENYLSVLWFIENVYHKLDQTNQLYIIGANPPEFICKYSSEKIIITGYVESIDEYIKNCLCLASPLILGAGIKIKILEMMSAGIPVIANTISMEGINAVPDKDYLHCETPVEYINAIKKLNNSKQLCRILGDSGRKFIMENFDYRKKTDIYIKSVLGESF